MKKYRLVCFLFICALSLKAQDTTTYILPHGYSVSVWHWASKTEPFGINSVVTDLTKSKIALESYKKNHVTRVYGGYLRLASDKDTRENLKTWNTLLHSNHIKSIYLIGSPKWIYDEYQQDMINLIEKNYIDFNKNVGETERLDGIHLDIEVHALPEWTTATAERKREMMFALKDRYKAVRELLKIKGMESDEIMADIPFWFDHITAVGWQSEGDRKMWFDDVSNYLDGFSIMNYENNSVSSLINRTQWERKNFKGIIEIGIDYEEIGTTWQSDSEFREALAQIAHQTKAPIAIHRYAFVLKNHGKPLVREDE